MAVRPQPGCCSSSARNTYKALTLLAQALATAEQLGLKALADDVGSLKLAADAAESPLTLPTPV
jgi:hypothetical protein